MKAYTLHENQAWIEPLVEAFAALGVPHEDWHLDGGMLDLAAAPPEGVFYNRMSASAHTRGHRFAPEYASIVIDWLESHGRPVVNGARALHLEVSKMGQYAALARHGVAVPRTIAVTEGGENAAIADAVARVADTHFANTPFILKPNRGGRGQGVVLLRSAS